LRECAISNHVLSLDFIDQKLRWTDDLPGLVDGFQPKQHGVSAQGPSAQQSVGVDVSERRKIDAKQQLKLGKVFLDECCTFCKCLTDVLRGLSGHKHALPRL
jgi:hypothetical protein